MISKLMTVEMPNGLDARPVAELVQMASRYVSTIHIESGTIKVNAKSIMGIMAFNPTVGMSVDIVVDGKDEEEALQAMEKFLVCE